MKKCFLYIMFLFWIIDIQSHAVVLSIDPLSQSVQLGSQVSFNLNIAGLGNGTALGTYDINIGFNHGMLDFPSISFGNQLDLYTLGDVQIVTPSNGTVEVYEVSLESVSDLNSLQSSSFTLATLTFQTLTLGMNSPITLSVNALGDASGYPILASLQNGSVSIIPVPEPELWNLMLLGGGLVGYQVKRKKAKMLSAG